MKTKVAVAFVLGLLCGAVACYTIARPQYAMPVDAVFVGSVRSTIYHDPACRYARKIPLDSRRWFRSRDEAATCGYRPCKLCLKLLTPEADSLQTEPPPPGGAARRR